MKPIYFPVTAITKPQAKLLGDLFGEPVIVYAPSADDTTEALSDLSDAGAVDIRRPSDQEDRALKNLVREYRIWVETHQGQGLTFFQNTGSGKPYFDELKPSRIRSDIQRRTNGNNQERPVDNPVLMARLFLMLAQEWQMQNDALARDLSQIEDQEKALFSMMKGGIEDNESMLLRGAFAGSEDPGNHLTGSLITAWTLLWLQDPVRSPLLVTGSPAVWEYMNEMAPESVQTFRIPEARLAEITSSPDTGLRDTLAGEIALLAEGRLPEQGGRSVLISKGPETDAESSTVHIRAVSFSGDSPFFATGGAGMEKWLQMADVLSPFKNIVLIFLPG